MKALDQIRARLEAATPVNGWYIHPNENGHLRGPYNRWLNVVGPLEELRSERDGKVLRADYKADLEMFAHAPTDIARLIRAVEAFEEMCDVMFPNWREAPLGRTIERILEGKDE